MKKLHLSLFIALVAVLATFSCKKKDEGSGSNADTNPYNLDVEDPNQVAATPPTFNDLDAEEVSSEITFEGSTKSAGTPPAPTGDITLYGNGSTENIRSTTGRTIELDISNSSFGAEGVYLQVDGSSEYFDIPLESSTAAAKTTIPSKKYKRTISGKVLRTAQGDETLSIDIPSSLPQGKFCVSYCVYLGDGVSDIITRCIEVQTLGGDASIQGEWNFRSATLFEEGEVISVVKGQPYSYSYAGDDLSQAERNCWSKDTYTINNYKMTFNSNGSYTEYMNSFDESYWLDENGNCVKDEEYSGDYEDTYSGSWSYDNSISTLTMIEQDDEYYYDPYFIEYRVRLDGSKMTLSYIEPYDNFFFSYVLNMEK